MNRYVIVDICGTLFYANTTFDFIDFIVHDGKYIRFRKMMKTKGWRYINSAVYRMMGRDLSREIALKYLRGKKRDDLLEAANMFYDTYLEERKVSEVWDVVGTQQEVGQQIVLASGTIDVIAEVVAERMGVEKYVSSQLGYSNGICEGRLIQDNLRNKQRKLEAIGVEAPYAMVITDNFADKALIQFAEGAYVLSYGDEDRWKCKRSINFIKADARYAVER